MSFRDAAIAFARGLVQTDLFKAMVSASSLFVVDKRGKMTFACNAEVLDALWHVRGTVPKLAEVEEFVKHVDLHLLSAISKTKGQNAKLYALWVKCTSKVGKGLLASRERNARKTTKRPKQTASGDKEITLTQQNKERTCATVNLLKTEDPVTSMASGASSSAMLADLGTPSTGASTASVSASVDGGHPGDFNDVEVKMFKCKGKEVLAKFPGSVCLCCREPFAETDSVNMTSEGACHEWCLHLAAAWAEVRKDGPMPPNRPAQIRAQDKSRKTSTSEPSPGITEDMAIKRHDQLMLLSKAMNISGETNGKKWRIKYEPIKKGTWLKTRHQVIVRRSGSSSKTVPFAFSEHTMTDDEFKARLQAAIDSLRKEVEDTA